MHIIDFLIEFYSFVDTFHFISCSSLSNFSVQKNSPKVSPKPSHRILIVVIETLFLLSLNRLYTVDGVTPDIFASSFAAIPRSLHNSLNLSTTAFFYFRHNSALQNVFILLYILVRFCVYALAYMIGLCYRDINLSEV